MPKRRSPKWIFRTALGAAEAPLEAGLALGSINPRNFRSDVAPLSGALAPRRRSRQTVREPRRRLPLIAMLAIVPVK